MISLGIRKSRGEDMAEQKRYGVKRKRATVYLSADVLDAARGATVWLQQKVDHRASFAGLVEEAIRRELRRLAKLHRKTKANPSPDETIWKPLEGEGVQMRVGRVLGGD